MDQRSAYRTLAGLLIPPRCALCEAPCRARDTACAACRCRLEAAQPGHAYLAGVGPVCWAAPYEGAARDLVAALKFRGRLGLAELAGEAITAALPAGFECASVVAVPPAPLRLRRRGFDPAESVAAAVGKRLGVPLEPALRRRGGPRQVGRPRRERIGSPPRVRATGQPPYPALLIDDVLTTGATLGACATALRSAGCAELHAAVFARALGAAPPAA